MTPSIMKLHLETGIHRAFVILRCQRPAVQCSLVSASLSPTLVPWCLLCWARMTPGGLSGAPSSQLARRSSLNFSFLLFETVSCSPGWPQIFHVAEDDLELLVLLPSIP